MRPRFLTRIDRYLIAKFLGTYFFSILLIISIAVVFDFNENVDKFTTNHATWHAIIFQYYLNFVPYYTNLFSALFVFLSVIFFTTKLADNSEIIAMISTGMSFGRLLRPYLISSAISTWAQRLSHAEASSVWRLRTSISAARRTPPMPTMCSCRWIPA